MNNKRYNGEPSRLYDFMNQYSIVCPKCQQEGIIEVASFLDTKNAELKCHHCYFSEKVSERLRFRLAAKAKCFHCLAMLSFNIVHRQTKPKYINVVCQQCKVVNKVSENWEQYMLKYNQSGIVDPIFGLPLWYQVEIKEEVLWAFNAKHLKEIRSYVSSGLRERTTDKFKMTMVEKLPDWIKIAKNRKDVIKAIDKILKC